MRAVLCNGFDGIKALSVGEAAEPHPGGDEVLIDVHAASVSYMDYLMICGGYQMRPALPYVPGTDAAGTVVACGGSVKRFRPGDRVACGNWFGSFAERVTAKASNTVHLPGTVDFIVGSTILHCYLTAWYDLVNRAQLQAGETVLVTGAAGGVGLACVEFARSLGARVIAAVGAAWPTSANMDDFSTFFVTELSCRNSRHRSRRLHLRERWFANIWIACRPPRLNRIFLDESRTKLNGSPILNSLEA